MGRFHWLSATTVNSGLADTPLLRTLAITDKIHPRGLTENESQYYRLMLFWTQNDVPKAGLQITVGHQTMADQNLPMSDEMATLVGDFVRPIFCCNI